MFASSRPNREKAGARLSLASLDTSRVCGNRRSKLNCRVLGESVRRQGGEVGSSERREEVAREREEGGVAAVEVSARREECRGKEGGIWITLAT